MSYLDGIWFGDINVSLKTQVYAQELYHHRI
jgi:hypothetical protein